MYHMTYEDLTNLSIHSAYSFKRYKESLNYLYDASYTFVTIVYVNSNIIITYVHICHRYVKSFQECFR